jgi:hypothetical protein
MFTYTLAMDTEKQLSIVPNSIILSTNRVSRELVTDLVEVVVIDECLAVLNLILKAGQRPRLHKTRDTRKAVQTLNGNYCMLFQSAVTGLVTADAQFMKNINWVSSEGLLGVPFCWLAKEAYAVSFPQGWITNLTNLLNLRKFFDT